jgi:hypothetical protein
VKPSDQKQAMIAAILIHVSLQQLALHVLFHSDVPAPLHFYDDFDDI